MLTFLSIILYSVFFAVVVLGGLCVLIDIICYFTSTSNSMLNDIVPSKKSWKEHQEHKIEWYEEVTSPLTKNIYSTSQIWHKKQIKEFPTISFKQFEQFYYLNPDSWTLKDCRVFKNNDNALSFTFTYFEWLKYLKFKKHIVSNKEKQATYERTIREMKVKDDTTRKILEAVQQDIDNIRSEAQKNVSDAIELASEVELQL